LKQNVPALIMSLVEKSDLCASKGSACFRARKHFTDLVYYQKVSI